jgi:holo-[acyl-carrier protein] synthase
MIIGIGTDLCEIGRIQAALNRFGSRFARKVLVEEEYVRYEQQRKQAAYVAKRFAAKEAFSKALGTGMRHPVSWHGIRVVNSRAGRPELRFSNSLEAYLMKRGITDVHVSLTDETGMACAFVIVEGRGA